jgi:hypothetical protein
MRVREGPPKKGGRPWRGGALTRIWSSARMIHTPRRLARAKCRVEDRTAFAEAIAQALGECFRPVLPATDRAGQRRVFFGLVACHDSRQASVSASGEWGTENTGGTHGSKLELREKTSACGKGHKKGKKPQPAGKVTKIASLEGKSTVPRAREKAPTLGKSGGTDYSGAVSWFCFEDKAAFGWDGS